MAEETIKDLTTEDFNLLVDDFIARGDDRIEPSVFLRAMAEVERKRAVKEIELTGQVINGEIVFDTPAPIHVEANTLYVGDTKVTLILRSAA